MTQSEKNISQKLMLSFWLGKFLFYTNQLRKNVQLEYLAYKHTKISLSLINEKGTIRPSLHRLCTIK